MQPLRRLHGACPLCGRAVLGVVIFIIILLSLLRSAAQTSTPAASPYARWKNGPPSDPNFFPIAVWLQNPAKAARYKEAGINVYVGLWRGPTEAQLAALKEAGMKVICHQNEVGLRHRDDPIIIGWMHGDEPDNAQSLGEGKGYGPPIPPAQIVKDYERLRAADPTRPVLLNLGQGVAWDRWHGRGVRTNHPEDYPEYIKGCDIVSFDIYPVAHSHPEVQGQLWYVARGVERLKQWSRPDQVVWNCIECTRISSTQKATAAQVRAEVWMSLVHGSRGLIYFVHEWKPRFNESALLDDAELLPAVTAINRQIHKLAPVLNEPPAQDAIQVVSDPPQVPVAATARRHGGALYVFAVAMRDQVVKAAFTLKGAAGVKEVEVLDEGRRLPVRDGVFVDQFDGYGVHLYRVTLGR